MRTGDAVGATRTDRDRVLDAARVVAANLIVWHHFGRYGPMGESAATLMPALADWLSSEARKVVQLFLVFGGYFAASALMPGVTSTQARVAAARDAWRAMAHRFVRLAVPLWVALGLALLASALARALATGAPVGAAPTLPQVLAHVVLLQDVLGYPALSAGVWYVAIDFQLFACMVLLTWLGARVPRKRATMVVLAVMVVAVAASAWVFNRDAGGDAWAPYFVAAYGLGALAWWAVAGVRHARAAMALASAIVVTSLVVDFRDRLVLALVVAWGLVALGAWRARRVPASAQETDPRTARDLTRLAAGSYALFVLHDPVLTAFNAVWPRFLGLAPAMSLLGLVAAWIVSAVLADVVHRTIEQRALRALRPRATHQRSAVAAFLDRGA